MSTEKDSSLENSPELTIEVTNSKGTGTSVEPVIETVLEVIPEKKPEKPPVRPDFENSVVFVSNSDLDGFREGDGDLMDKMVENWNSLGIPAVRVIQTSHNVPEDKLPLFDNGHLMALSDENTTALLNRQDELRQEFLRKLDNEYAGKNVTVYIGSRINVTNTETGALSESGSLFTKEFIEQLKERGVKVAVNCLEFDFFGRSTRELPRQAEMLRQQLFQADKIHFLNEYDQLGFERTVAQLSVNPNLLLHPVSHKMQEQPYVPIDLSGDIEKLGGDKALKALPEKGVFISGIFTVDPLTDKKILESREKETDTVEDVLSHRPPNVLCFGLMRGAKGIDEAIQLGNLLQKNEQPNRVIIAGKLMGSYFLLQKMMKDIFEIDSPAELRKEIQTVLNDHLKKHHGLEENINLNKEKIATIFENRFGSDFDSFNQFSDSLYKHLSQKYPEKGKNIELHFNVPEEQVRDLAMNCRYAIKLDHKGMANNASTIVSCLGFYLPTFTSVGMVTGNDFRTEGLHDVHDRPKGSKVEPYTYQHTVMMPKEEYFLENGELKPVNPTIEDIAKVITTETDEQYLQRIQELRQLHQHGVFDSRCVSIRVLNQILTPLNNEILQSKGVNIEQYAQYAVVPEELGVYSNSGSLSSGHTGAKGSERRPPKLEKFNRVELGSKQRGWNCGDVAIGVERNELVQWMNENSGDPGVRALLAPEIRTAAMMTAILMNQQNEEMLDKGAKQKQLMELLELSEALGDEESTNVQKEINKLLDGKKPDMELVRLALPEAMRTPELLQLVNNYQQAHEDMQPAVALCNDRLGNLEGNRLSLQELDEFFREPQNRLDHALAYQGFSEARQNIFAPSELAFNNYCNSQETFTAYTNEHYGNEQWMVYHPHNGGHDNSSIMDVTARMLGTQVNVYVYRGGEYVLDHQTQQYGEGVRNVLYNGVNHYIQLEENPYYVQPIKGVENSGVEESVEKSSRNRSNSLGTGSTPDKEEVPNRPRARSWDGEERRVNHALRKSLEPLEKSGGHEAVQSLLEKSVEISSEVQAKVDPDQDVSKSNLPAKGNTEKKSVTV